MKRWEPDPVKRLVRILEAVQPHIVALFESTFQNKSPHVRAVARKLRRRKGLSPRTRQYLDSIATPRSSSQLALVSQKAQRSSHALALSRGSSPSERIESSDRKMITPVAKRNPVKPIRRSRV